MGVYVIVIEVPHSSGHPFRGHVAGDETYFTDLLDDQAAAVAFVVDNLAVQP